MSTAGNCFSTPALAGSARENRLARVAPSGMTFSRTSRKPFVFIVLKPANCVTDGILQTILDPIQRSASQHFMVNERQLLKSLQQLDPEAITAIHNRFFAEVFRYARYRLGDIHLAEDVAAETFARLLAALHARKGPRTSLRGWLLGTASNLVNDHFRKSYARPVEPISEEAEASAGNPVLHAEQAERQQAIRAALGALPQSQQHVLALRFGGGYSLAETAEIMGKKQNAVKQLQFRALSALRQEFGGDFDV